MTSHLVLYYHHQKSTVYQALGFELYFWAKEWYNTKEENKLSLELAIVVAAINGDRLSPQITTSSNYKHWVSFEDWKRCIECANNHGKVWLIAEQPYPDPPIHPNCRCSIELMQAITAGTATIKHFMKLFKKGGYI